jgi:hypothetical protein
MTQITNDMLTDWISAEVKPVRPGVYQTLMKSGSVFWRAFDGVDWRYTEAMWTDCRSPTFARATKCSTLPEYFITDRALRFSWRGLNKEV